MLALAQYKGNRRYVNIGDFIFTNNGVGIIKSVDTFKAVLNYEEEGKRVFVTEVLVD